MVPHHSYRTITPSAERDFSANQNHSQTERPKGRSPNRGKSLPVELFSWTTGLKVRNLLMPGKSHDATHPRISAVIRPQKPDQPRPAPTSLGGAHSRRALACRACPSVLIPCPTFARGRSNRTSFEPTPHCETF